MTFEDGGVQGCLLWAEIRDYAAKIGIDVASEAHLLHLARDGLMQALPPGWKPW